MPVRKFQVLCLSGGGYRGLHVARILELIEHQTQTRSADHFDLIAGTSVGGIIALALAMRVPASEIRATLETVGPELFPAPPPAFVTLRDIFAEKGWLKRISRAFKNRQDLKREFAAAKSAWYDPEPLKQALCDPKYFGDKTIGDLLHPVIIPAVNYSDGLPKFFKTDHHKSLVFDKSLKVIDVAMGTSAAPVYFPAHRVNDWRIVDGGLIANDPTQVAVHEAMKFFGIRPPLFGDTPNDGHDDLRVLSIGTLAPRHFADATSPLNRGLLDWGTGAFELSMSAQEAMAAFMVDEHLLPGKVIRLPRMEARPEKAPGMADVNGASTEILKASAIKLTQYAFGQEKFTDLFKHKARTLDEIRKQILEREPA